jgi:hypothetical protein
MTESKQSEPNSRGRQFLYGATNWILFLAGAVNLVVGTISAVRGDVSRAVTSLTAGLVLIFAATIDRFELLQGLGMKAQTRQLDEKLEQADDALAQLRELAELTGAALVDLSSKSGRWSAAPSPSDQYEFGQSVRSVLKTLGSGGDVITTKLRPWASVMCYDLAFALTDDLREALQETLANISRQLTDITSQPINPADPMYLRATAEQREVLEFLQQRLNNIGYLDLGDFPDKFLDLFDKVPLLDEAVIGPMRVKARSLADSMRILKENMEIPDPQRWFAEIEASRARANPVGAAMARGATAA